MCVKRASEFFDYCGCVLLRNAFSVKIDRDRAHHPSVHFEGGRGPGVRRCVGMVMSGNEGRVIQLSKTQQTATTFVKRSQGCCG